MDTIEAFGSVATKLALFSLSQKANFFPIGLLLHNSTLVLPTITT